MEISKLDVVRYYYSIARWMVPHTVGRPLTLVHCPEGLNGECRFMKHSKVWGPGVIRRVKIREKKKIGEYMVADDATALAALAQMGILEIHTWNSTVDDIEHPDRLVFDLDPGDLVEWTQVVDAARLFRRVLSSLGLESFPKTTGGRGLHVVVPLIPSADVTIENVVNRVKRSRSDPWKGYWSARQRLTGEMMRAVSLF